MVRFSLLFFALLIAFSNTLFAQDTDEDPDMALLPMGEGREEVFYLCSACHSIRTVVQQKLSRNVWDETLEYMVEEHGMPELDEEDHKLILDYLATHVSPEK